MPTLRTTRFGPLAVRWDERVLEPRPWTLLQSDWAAELAPTLPDGPFLELCAGAGQIGQAAAFRSGRPLVQVERDPVAARFARGNAEAAGLGRLVEVREAALEEAIGPGETFCLVLADPPYLPTDEVGHWPGDPVTAIDGGVDGLEVIRACLRVAADHLPPGGPLLLQVAGRRQADQVSRLDRCFAVGEVRAHDDRRAVVLLRRLPT